MKKSLYLYIILTSLLFISRLFFFITTQDVGVEHDSGWYLGVARNVAERGIYAASVNTIDTSEKPGSFASIFGRYSSQDKNGYIYFPAGVTVGPIYVLPEAFFLKMFGYGWTQYRLWPFIALCLLIPLLFYVALQLGSLFGLFFFQVWLWAYPQVFLNQSYEALSEHIALLFLLAGYVFFQKMVNSPRKVRFLLLSGLSLGLSFQTKNIYALGIVFPCIALIWDGWKKGKKKSIKYILMFFVFLALPTLLYEVYRFVSLLAQFGFDGYWKNNIDIKRTLVSGGSGITILRKGLDWRFILNKLSVWNHLGAPLLVVWSLILTSPLLRKRRTLLFWNLYASVVFFFVWFSLLSSTGFFRHIFPAAVMGMILSSLSLDSLLSISISIKKRIVFYLFVLTSCLLIIALYRSPLATPGYIITKNRAIQLHRAIFPNKLQGPLSHPVFSKKNQDEVSRYINEHVQKSTRICFYKDLLVAEMPILVDRVFFPLPRCTNRDILIIGPYQKGEFALTHTKRHHLEDKVCKKIIFSNGEYSLCTLNNRR